MVANKPGYSGPFGLLAPEYSPTAVSLALDRGLGIIPRERQADIRQSPNLKTSFLGRSIGGHWGLGAKAPLTTAVPLPCSLSAAYLSAYAIASVSITSIP